MTGKLELDIHDLMTELRLHPVIKNQGLWDPHQTTLIGDSYIRIDNSCVVCILGIRVFQPFISQIIRRDYITIQYLQVSGNYYHHHNGQAHHIKSGSFTLTAAEKSHTEILQLRTHSTTVPTRAVSIHIHRDHLVETFGLNPDLWLKEYRDAFFNRSKLTLSVASPLTPDMWLALDSLLDCSFEEPIRTMYLKAKTMELLMLTVVQLNNISRPGSSGKLSSNERDQRLIDIAALIYRRELHNPPSIDELSRRIGINRNKLTSGFRSCFGATPAEYSRNLRLEWATRRLADGVAIGQVAAETGYDSLAAFSRAYRQHYGYAPSETSNLNK